MMIMLMLTFVLMLVMMMMADNNTDVDMCGGVELRVEVRARNDTH